MKIVYFIDHLRPDGTQYVLRQLVRGLGKRGHRQLVFCLNDSYDHVMIDQLKQAGVELVMVGKLSLLTGEGFFRILKILRQEKFDCAVTLLFFADVIGRLAARLAGVPWIVTSIQTHDEFYHSWQRWLERRTMSLADRVLLNSENYRDFAIREEGISPDQLVVIFNAIDADSYSMPSHSGLKTELGLSPDVKLLGSTGRLTYQKGFDVLVRALALMEHIDAHLAIAGIGEELAFLQELAGGTGVADRVHFLGFRRDIPWVLAGLDVYVHASRYEGMPIAVLEAMAAGRPIVATAVDGTKELIRHTAHGWLAPPDDPQSLAFLIDGVLSSPEEAKLLGRAARDRVMKDFSEERMISLWEAALTAP